MMANSSGFLTSLTLLGQLRSLTNNERAWGTFLERYRPLIYGWCRRSGLKHDDREDVSAAVLHKLTKAMRSFVHDGKHRFRSWLRTVVTNEVISFWRYEARRPDLQCTFDPRIAGGLEEIQDPRVEDLVQELDQELERDLRQAERVTVQVRQRVEPRVWQAYWLTAIENESAGEAARRLGMKITTVYEAKRRVGRMLREEGLKLQHGAEDHEGAPP